jgi:hypothetical protein
MNGNIKKDETKLIAFLRNELVVRSWRDMNHMQNDVPMAQEQIT